MRPPAPTARLFPACRFADAISRQPHPWLWPHRLPLGRLTLLIGDPGIGKSLLVADIAARVSAGRPWPEEHLQPALPRLPDPSPTRPADRPPPQPPRPGDVLLIAPNDDAAALLVPRLAAAGADLARVMILDGVSRFASFCRTDADVLCTPDGPRPIRISPRPAYGVGNSADPLPTPLALPDHLDQLTQALDLLAQPRLLVLDSLHDVLSAAVQANPDALAKVLAGLAALAHNRALTILATANFAKTRGPRMLYRIRGSLSFLAAARAAHLLAPDPEDPDRRILAPLKTIYGHPPPPLAFRAVDQPLPAPKLPDGAITSYEEMYAIMQQPMPPGLRALLDKDSLAAADQGSDTPPLRELAPCLHWERPGPGTPDAATLADFCPDSWSALNDACRWLIDFLAAGPQPAIAAYSAARANGFAPRTLRRAKRLLAVRSFKPAASSAWLWGPDDESHNTEPHSPISQGGQIGARVP